MLPEHPNAREGATLVASEASGLRSWAESRHLPQTEASDDCGRVGRGDLVDAMTGALEPDLGISRSLHGQQPDALVLGSFSQSPPTSTSPLKADTRARAEIKGSPAFARDARTRR